MNAQTILFRIQGISSKSLRIKMDEDEKLTSWESVIRCNEESPTM